MLTFRTFYIERLEETIFEHFLSHFGQNHFAETYLP